MSEQTANLLLIGVGSGGCRFASTAAMRFGPGIQAIGFDTDALYARSISGMRCMLLGAARYDGHSTGGDIVKGRTAATDDTDNIKNVTKGVRLAVVVTALGGGTGTGATPEILSVLRSQGATTLCLATLPFEFEGKDRATVAQRAIPVLEENADALVVLKLDDLYAPDVNAPISQAMAAAEGALADSLTLLWSLIFSPGYISVNPEKLISLLMQSAGRCRFAVASADGQARAAECVGKLCKSAMLGAAPSLESVQAVLVGVLAGSDLRLAELSEVSSSFRSAVPPSCEFTIGTVLDERYSGTLKLVAIMFDAIQPQEAAAPEGTADELQPITSTKRTHKKSHGDSKLTMGATGRGRFKDVEGTILNGQDLDTPTYLRQRIALDR